MNWRLHFRTTKLHPRTDKPISTPLEFVRAPIFIPDEDAAQIKQLSPYIIISVLPRNFPQIIALNRFVLVGIWTSCISSRLSATSSADN
jgi:hypothetical protein